MMRSVSRSVAVCLFGASVLLTSVAQLLFRAAMAQASAMQGGGLLATWAMLQSLPPAAIWMLGIGLSCYALSMLAWIIALSRFDVSAAYPALSVSYVLVYLAAVYLPWLHETPSLLKVAGIVTIAAGVFLIAASSRRSAERLVAKE
jgi:undecaprenyl phosphate-alpha-L-ara4N flippase subunit ArnF